MQSTDSAQRRPGNDRPAGNSSPPDFPQVFGKYVLLRPMARGGMGELFLSAAGEVGGFEKMCVVKKVLADLDDATVRRRFLDEAKVVVRLNHSNLVQVFDAGRVADEYYLTMELVEGKDLRAIWNRCAQMKRRIPVEFAIFVIRDVCRGLHYVHDSMGLDLVHRDISPPNILVSYHGQVKITDFGLAKHAIKRELTMPGVVYGRYSYLAPEQARGQPADRRSDIYAAGIVLWEMLTGRQMFPIENRVIETKALNALRNPRFVPPSSLVPGIPEGLDRVLKRALEPERADRYQSAGEFRGELAEVLARHHPSYDMDRVAEFMREIFEHERRIELQDYASYAREDFSRVRNSRPKSASYSIGENGPEHGGEDAGSSSPAWARAARGGAASGIARNGNPAAARNYERGGATGQGYHVSEDHTLPVMAGQQGSMARWDSPDTEELQIASQARLKRIIAGRYRLERLLGIGGMGAVYVATHLALGKTYALKILHEFYGKDSEISARFMREARAATQTGHPNIIDVVDIGTMDTGELFLVMELLHGIDLSRVIKTQGPLNIRRAVHIARQVCRALAAAHAAGIIHRDLKSENIMIVNQANDPDFVKVLDFGICKQVDSTSSAETSPGLVMGSPDYMAPEQAAGAEVDVQSDVYALGTVLFEMLAGEVPFNGRNAIDVLMKKGREDAPNIQTRRPEVPDALADVIDRCLERDRRSRPANMRAVEYEITRAIDGRAMAVAAAMGIKVPDAGRDRAFADNDELATSFSGDGSNSRQLPEFEVGSTASESQNGASVQTVHEQAERAEQAQRERAESSSTRIKRPAGNLAVAARALLFVGLGGALVGAGLVSRFADRDNRSTPELGSSDESMRAGKAPAESANDIEPGQVSDSDVPTAAVREADAPTAEDAGAESTAAQPDVEATTAEVPPTQPASAEASTTAAESGVSTHEPSPSDPPDVQAIVERAEAALKSRHWSDPATGSLAMELTNLSLVDPAHEALGRLRREASRALLPEAEGAFSRKEWERAARAYRELAAVSPETPEAANRLAEALMQLARDAIRTGDIVTAKRATGELLNKRPRSVDAHLLRAQALEAASDWPGAAGEYRSIIRLEPKHRGAQTGLKRVAKLEENTKSGHKD